MPPSPSKNLILLICAVMHGLNHAFQLLLPPLYLAIRDELGLSGLSPVMLLGTVYFVIYGAIGLPYGILGDRFSKKKILVCGILLNGLGYFIAAVTSSYPVFFAAMVLGGLGGGAYHPVANALISNLFEGRVGRAFGLIGMGASFGLFLGPVASGYIGQQFGWRVSCLAFALFGFLVAAAFWLVMPEEKKEIFKENEAALPKRAFIILLMPVVIFMGFRDFCLWGTTYLTPAMSELTLGFSKKSAGALIGLMSLSGVLSQPLAGTLSDRIGRRRMIFIALVVAGISVALFPYLNAMLIFPVAFMGGFALLGTVPVLDAITAEIVPPSIRGKVFGGVMTIGITLGALSPYVVGLIHDHLGGYRVAYLTLGLVGLAGAGLVFTIPAKE